MKVLCLQGSPRIDGNTATVLGWVEEGLSGKGYEVERINLQEKNINYCLSCYTCQSVPDEAGCCQDDDGLKIMKKMIDADAIIWSTPLYVGTFAAPVKTMLDRSIALLKRVEDAQLPKSLVGGKTTALVVTCAGPAENNSDLMEETFKRLAFYSGMKNVGTLVVPGCTTPDAIGQEFRDLAAKLAAEIAG